MSKRLVKSQSNKTICGVCGGIAEYLGIDPTIFRIIYVLLTIFTAFSGVLIYLILYLLMPSE